MIKPSQYRKRGAGILIASVGIIAAGIPGISVAKTEAGAHRQGSQDTVKNVEIVSDLLCFPRENLESLVAEHMQFPRNRPIRADAAVADEGHVRLIVSDLLNAGGSIQSIGPTGRNYIESPFWSHPVEITIQLVVNSIAVNEMSEKSNVSCASVSSDLGQTVTDLANKFCRSPEISGNHAISPCGGK